MPERIERAAKILFDGGADYVLNDVDPEGVLFYASIEGRSYKCIITRLALSTHCNAGAGPEHHHRHGAREECLARFHASRAKVYGVADRVIRQKGVVSRKVLITAGDFTDGTT